MNYWVLKSEPHVYSFDQLTADKSTWWTGVRNYQARNNLRLMKARDIAVYFHTADEKAAVGLATITEEAKPDPTAPKDDWSAVKVAPLKPFKVPVTLATLKATKKLEQMALVRHSRLSVSPLTKAEYETIVSMGMLLR